MFRFTVYTVSGKKQKNLCGRPKIMNKLVLESNKV